ncbi:MAG: YaiI/YqxD family protein [bacterium]
MLEVFVDADACPVKDEVYRVAKRHGLTVHVVANSWMRVPVDPDVRAVVVKGDFDAADDWIVEHVGPDDIVISTDIPLASRCLPKGALVLRPNGRPFTEDNIGDALASRELLSQLRDLGEVSGGPAPFGPKDRSVFLQRLEETVQAIRRKAKPGSG